MRPTIAIYGIQDRNSFDRPGFTHDHSICRMENGQVTHYLQLERWTRRKYDNRMHLHIEELLGEGHVPLTSDTDLVFVNSFVGNSFISQNGQVRFESQPRKALTPDVVDGYGWVGLEKWQGQEYQAYSMDHELAHVSANLPFHGTFRENSLLIHFDGGASLGNFSAYLLRKGKLEVLECHWELSQLSKLFNDNALSFALLNHQAGEHCAVPGKLMGFATLRPAQAELKRWLHQNDWFKDIWQDATPFYTKAKSEFGWAGKLGDTHDPFLQSVAACIQAAFQHHWMNHLAKLQERIQADHLYLSGGCALNIVANTAIINTHLFQEVFIPPCPGDSGLSLGAAAFLEWKKHGTISQQSPYLNSVGLKPKAMDWDQTLVQQVSDAIAAGKVIGFYQGNGEIGPRALGNRSIIARPDSRELAQKVSMTCKGREWYRPIAPVMREEQARRLTGLAHIHHLSRYMLLDFKIPEQHHAPIQGVVHANGTARIQTLFTPSDNPFLWALLCNLEKAHGIPALINTSFNQQGEPIVHTEAQALQSAKDMKLDGVVLSGTFQKLKSWTGKKYKSPRTGRIFCIKMKSSLVGNSKPC